VQFEVFLKGNPVLIVCFLQLERVWSVWRVHLHRQRTMYTLAGAVRLACQSRAISSHLAFLRSWSCFRALSSAIVSRANALRRARLSRVCLQVTIKDDDDAVMVMKKMPHSACACRRGTQRAHARSELAE
jgi:hypothetical protein